MQKQGKVNNIFLSIKGSGKESREQIHVDLEGIHEDKFYAKGVKRSILIASLDSYTLAANNGIDMEPGALGENLLIDVNPYGLKSGDKLSIGETILEITQHCTICNSLAKVDVALPNLLQNDRGIFAKTFKSGVISVGDEVKFL